jgi:hypothetical protein
MLLVLGRSLRSFLWWRDSPLVYSKFGTRTASCCGVISEDHALATLSTLVALFDQKSYHFTKASTLEGPPGDLI